MLAHNPQTQAYRQHAKVKDFQWPGGYCPKPGHELAFYRTRPKTKDKEAIVQDVLYIHTVGE